MRGRKASLRFQMVVLAVEELKSASIGMCN
jgi:hypothetical protein